MGQQHIYDMSEEAHERVGNETSLTEALASEATGFLHFVQFHVQIPTGRTVQGTNDAELYSVFDRRKDLTEAACEQAGKEVAHEPKTPKPSMRVQGEISKPSKCKKGGGSNPSKCKKGGGSNPSKCKKGEDPSPRSASSGGAATKTTHPMRTIRGRRFLPAIRTRSGHNPRVWPAIPTRFTQLASRCGKTPSILNKINLWTKVMNT